MRNRSVIEVMILTFTLLVAITMLTGWFVVAFIKIRDPAADTDTFTQTMMSLTSGILGALLGLIAGRQLTKNGINTRPDGTSNGLTQGESNG